MFLKSRSGTSTRASTSLSLLASPALMSHWTSAGFLAMSSWILSYSLFRTLGTEGNTVGCKCWMSSNSSLILPWEMLLSWQCGPKLDSKEHYFDRFRLGFRGFVESGVVGPYLETAVLHVLNASFHTIC